MDSLIILMIRVVVTVLSSFATRNENLICSKLTLTLYNRLISSAGFPYPYEYSRFGWVLGSFWMMIAAMKSIIELSFPLKRLM